jgi:uncharacterized NAD-dependent epimerase/dehydratase family protein
MNDMCDYSDIIIVGSQSGTIPYDTANIEQYPLKQIPFLLATHPDAIVLCVNPYDPIEYIKRTIQFLESSIECKTVAIVIFPMGYAGGWSLEYGPKYALSDNKVAELKEIMSATFGIPVFCLGNSKDMEKLINCIIDFF